jgi:hypothetical protein
MEILTDKVIFVIVKGVFKMCHFLKHLFQNKILSWDILISAQLVSLFNVRSCKPITFFVCISPDYFHKQLSAKTNSRSRAISTHFTFIRANYSLMYAALKQMKRAFY